MSHQSTIERGRLVALDRPSLEVRQLERLNLLLKEVVPVNDFYNRKFQDYPKQLESLEQLASLPLTTKQELQPGPCDDPYALNRSYELERYVRFHQTSGTRGRPLAVLDTAEDWKWWINGWQYVLDAAQVTSQDVALLAFSFGPFIGFWSAFDALVERGALVIPGGGMSTLARIEMIRCARVTTLLSTPTYALRMAEVAAEHKISLADLGVQRIIVAGEPGGSVLATRDRMEKAWNARVIDHSGATEVGPWGFADPHGRGLLVNEAEFIAEFVSVETGNASHEGEPSHLILTSLGRWGAPVIRYRTGDVVRPVWNASRSGFVLLDGGILSRADDMTIVRGVNVFPTALEQILHSFPEVVEYRAVVRRKGSLDELIVEVEDHLQQPARIAKELQLRLGLRIDVRCVTSMSLPRFEGKGKRFLDERNHSLEERHSRLESTS